MERYTRRKVADFSKLLHGLRAAADVPNLFATVDIQSPLLKEIVCTTDDGGCFPSAMKETLDWNFDNFDLKKAAKGEYEPTRGTNGDFDAACDAMEDIQQSLEEYCQPEVLSYSSHILPIVFALLDDTNVVVQATSCYVLGMFCERLEPEGVRPPPRPPRAQARGNARCHHQAQRPGNGRGSSGCNGCGGRGRVFALRLLGA